MSLPQDCTACSMGQHAGHDAGENTRPGLIGGAVCDCPGDCAGRWQSKVDGMRTALDLVANRYDGPRGGGIDTSDDGVQISDAQGRRVYLRWPDALAHARTILSAAGTEAADGPMSW